MSCKDFFDQNRGNKKKCKLLQEMDEQLLAEWETETASEFSPGPVKDDEILVQQIVNPTHVLTPDGESLLPMSFDVCSSHGLSTNRISYSTVDELIARGEARVSNYNTLNPTKPQRTLWGFARYAAKDVRAILCEETGTRGIFVYDTANDTDASHAEFCQGGKQSKQSALARDVRFRLYELAKRNLVPFSQVNDNLLPAKGPEPA